MMNMTEVPFLVYVWCKVMMMVLRIPRPIVEPQPKDEDEHIQVGQAWRKDPDGLYSEVCL
jgi:hypothetical protein